MVTRFRRGFRDGEFGDLFYLGVLKFWGYVSVGFGCSCLPVVFGGLVSGGLEFGFLEF